MFYSRHRAYFSQTNDSFSTLYVRRYPFAQKVIRSFVYSRLAVNKSFKQLLKYFEYKTMEQQKTI